MGIFRTKKLLSKEFVINKLSEWKMQNEPFVLELEDDESENKPWEKKNYFKFEKEDILKPLTLTLADCIYIPKDTVKPRTMNRIRKMSTFSNPQFYKMQAMRYSTKQIPRYIQCFRDFDKLVALPRGCLHELKEKLQRILDFRKRLTELRNPQTEFVVCTLPTAEYAENQRKGIEFMKNMLKNSGVDIKEYDNLNCHFAVIDNDLVWYGSMNFLSREHDEDILMRLRSEEIVRELLSMMEEENHYYFFQKIFDIYRKSDIIQIGFVCDICQKEGGQWVDHQKGDAFALCQLMLVFFLSQLKMLRQ